MSCQGLESAMGMLELGHRPMLGTKSVMGRKRRNPCRIQLFGSPSPSLNGCGILSTACEASLALEVCRSSSSHRGGEV